MDDNQTWAPRLLKGYKFCFFIRERENVKMSLRGLQIAAGGDGFCWVVLQVVSGICISLILLSAFLRFQKCISECSFLWACQRQLLSLQLDGK